MSARPPTTAEARTLAEELELDVHGAGVCLACLCFVSGAIESGDEAEVRRTVASFSVWLWEEGLALPTRRALERARVRGSPLAQRAIDDVDRRGARSPVVRAVVRRLAEDLLLEWHRPKPARVIPLRPPA